MDYEAPLALYLVGTINRELIDVITVYNYVINVSLILYNGYIVFMLIYYFIKSKTHKNILLILLQKCSKKHISCKLYATFN